MAEPLEFEDRLTLRGKFPGGPGRGPRRARAGRICADEACDTVLSVYNDGDRCWEHTQPSPYLLNVRRFRATKISA
jgi:hypothetical protein